MTPKQKLLVQKTWLAVTPKAYSLAVLFYARLFQIAPATRALFAGVDQHMQRQKLIAAMTTVVGGLDKLDALGPMLAELGARHASYGVEDRHYGAVGAALLWALEGTLTDSWSNEVKIAWTNAYNIVAHAMRAAAQASESSSADVGLQVPGTATGRLLT